MSKKSGLGDNLYVAGHDLSGDIGSLGRIGGGPAALDLTGIDKSAFERLGGLRDGSMEFSAWYNPATDQAHPVLSALPTADVILVYCRGTTLGDSAAAMVAKQVNYDPSRGNDGSLAMAVQAVANAYGLEWGKQLTAGKQTDASGGSSAEVDGGAQSTHGAQAYLQAFSLGSGTAVVTIEDSATSGSGFGSLVAFSNVAGRTTERVTVAGTVERYVRVTTSGTFTDLVFAVVFVRNQVSVSF